MRLTKLSSFRNKFFEPDSLPAKATLIGLIESKEIKGVKIGSQFYIDEDAFIDSLRFIQKFR